MSIPYKLKPGDVDTNPSKSQIEAGNYKKYKCKLHGIDITIENPRGSVRSGVDENGNKWSNTIKHHYGYFNKTQGSDKDEVDVFIGPNPKATDVYIIDQVDKEGKFDEHKVLMGFDSKEDAKQGYLVNYDKGWKGLGNITKVGIKEFKSWLYTKRTLKSYNYTQECYVTGPESFRYELPIKPYVVSEEASRTGLWKPEEMSTESIFSGIDIGDRTASIPLSLGVNKSIEMQEDYVRRLLVGRPYVDLLVYTPLLTNRETFIHPDRANQKIKELKALFVSSYVYMQQAASIRVYNDGCDGVSHLDLLDVKEPLDKELEYVPVESDKHPGWYISPGYPEFLANKKGQVLNLRSGHITYGSPNEKGYLRTCLYDNATKTKVDVKVHAIVCSAFKGPRPKGYTVAHKNHVPGDNKSGNLKWSTLADNVSDANKRRAKKNW